MEMQMAARGHHHIAQLEREPLAAPDPHWRIIYSHTEYGAGEGNLARRQRPFAARRADRAIKVQRASPAARISAEKVALSPLAKVSVTSVNEPGCSVSSSSMAMI